MGIILIVVVGERPLARSSERRFQGHGARLAVIRGSGAFTQTPALDWIGHRGK
jgi:hypothetical protein